MDRECLFCGTILDEEEGKYICNDCDKKMKLLKQLEKVDKAQLKMIRDRKKYFHSKNTYDYENERFSVAEKVVKKGFVFRSVEEACVALECEKEGINYIPNYKIGPYTVDFIFPKMKVIFEVDGSLYHTDEDKDFLRERSIMSYVGEEYEIVRIEAESVPRFIILNLREAIEFVIDKRNFENKFRDSRRDTDRFYEYICLQSHLRRSKNK